MFDLTNVEIMFLIQMSSKAAEFYRATWSGLMQGGQTVDAEQYKAAVNQVIPVLAELDRQIPGVVPVPHDGVPWAERE